MLLHLCIIAFFHQFEQTYNNEFVPNVVVPNIFDKCYHIMQRCINHSSTHETAVLQVHDLHGCIHCSLGTKLSGIVLTW